MKTKDKSFKTILDEIEKMTEGSTDIKPSPVEPTEIMDYTDDFLKNKDIVSKTKNLNKIPLDELTPDQKEILRLRNLMGNIRMNKRLGELGLEGYKKQIPSMLEKAKPLVSKLSKARKAGKVGAALASPLAFIASEVLASEDVGEDEQSEISQMKKEKELESILPKEVIEKSKQIAQKPVTASDLIKTVQPMIKSVGGDVDMKPKKAAALVGEQESPDIEEMGGVVNYEDYLKKKKRQLGYE